MTFFLFDVFIIVNQQNSGDAIQKINPFINTLSRLDSKCQIFWNVKSSSTFNFVGKRVPDYKNDVISQWVFGAKMTSNRHRCDVITLIRRHFTLCARWDATIQTRCRIS